jgi:hypothetical protein
VGSSRPEARQKEEPPRSTEAALSAGGGDEDGSAIGGAYGAAEELVSTVHHERVKILQKKSVVLDTDRYDVYVNPRQYTLPVY